MQEEHNNKVQSAGKKFNKNFSRGASKVYSLVQTPSKKNQKEKLSFFSKNELTSSIQSKPPLATTKGSK